VGKAKLLEGTANRHLIEIDIEARQITTALQRVTTTFVPLLARSNRSVMSSLYMRMQP